MIPATSDKKDKPMGSEKVEPIKKESRMFAFDPTIHAGHILTILTIIFCSVGAWYDVKGSVASLKEENSRQEKEISDVRSDQKEQTQQLTENVNALALMNRQEMTKMRDDMNAWFMRISDKLEMKQDKK